MNKKELLMLIISLILIAVFTYLPHFSYNLPYHLDEWDHIGRSIRIQEQGFSYLTNNSPIEIGFDLILLIISKFIQLFNIDIVNIYQFLPAINVLIISSILFFNLKREYNYLIALPSFLFIISLPSNVNILGIWFYVPILAGMPLIYLILFSIEKNAYDENKIWLIALSLFFLAFIHQSSFLLITLVLIIYLAFNKNKMNLNLSKVLPFIFILIPIILTILYLTNNLSEISNLFESMIWGPIQPQINYNIFSLYGWLASILSFIGFYISSKNKQLLTFRIYYLISLISILIFPLIEKTIFSAYQRYLYHFMFAAIPLSAVGLYHSFKWLKNKTNNLGKILKYTIIILFILFIAISSIYQHSNFNSKTKLYTVLEEKEINSLKELSKYPTGTVLTPLDMGIAVKPITKIHEPALTFFDWEKAESLTYFYNADCEEKEEILYNKNIISFLPDYIHSESPIKCDFNEEIIMDKENYIYKTRLNKEVIHKVISKIQSNNNSSFSFLADTPREEFTLYFMIKPEINQEKYASIIQSGKGNGYDSGWSILLYDNKLNLRWKEDNEKKNIYTESDIKPNKWNFVTITYNKSFSIYIDSKIKNKSPYTKISFNESYHSLWKIGTTNFNIFNGEIKEITLINKSLSNKEISKEYYRLINFS